MVYRVTTGLVDIQGVRMILSKNKRSSNKSTLTTFVDDIEEVEYEYDEHQL